MTLIPTKGSTIVETHDTVIAKDVLFRIWSDVPGAQDGDARLASDERLTPEQARHLAAALLHAAFKCDGERITFKREGDDAGMHVKCDETITLLGMERDGLRAQLDGLFTVVGTLVVDTTE